MASPVVASPPAAVRAGGSANRLSLVQPTPAPSTVTQAPPDALDLAVSPTVEAPSTSITDLTAEPAVALPALEATTVPAPVSAVTAVAAGPMPSEQTPIAATEQGETLRLDQLSSLMTPAQAAPATRLPGRFWTTGNGWPADAKDLASMSRLDAAVDALTAPLKAVPRVTLMMVSIVGDAAASSSGSGTPYAWLGMFALAVLALQMLAVGEPAQRRVLTHSQAPPVPPA